MEKCLICQSENLKNYSSKISDFTAERIGIPADKQATSLYHCQECGFAYYDYRLSEDEAKKFYLGYRNEDYQKQRQKHDCWYTPEINEIIGKNEIEIQAKKQNMIEIIKGQVDLSKIKAVLDFGGDKGQNIPEIFAKADKFVYELSEVEPVSRVTLLKSFSELGKYDFIINQGVLEHVSLLSEILNDFKKISHPNTYFYIEVPFDSPFYKSPTHNLQFLFSKYYSLKNILKHYLKIKKEKSFCPMSEHLNYFTPQSLKFLIESNGFEIITQAVREVNHGWCKEKDINILCQLKRG